MKEIIETIIHAEEQLQKDSSQSQSQAQGILKAANDKIAAMEKEFEDRFNKEKEDKTKDVNQKAQRFEENEKVKLKAEIAAKQAKLSTSKQEVAERIIQAILDE